MPNLLPRPRVAGLATVSLIALVACTVLVGPRHGTTAEDADAKTPMVYELRTYTTAPGKLDDLHKRFANHTMKIFARHGMKNVVYWTPDDPKLKSNTLVYVLAHKSRAAASKSWAGFRNDPEWKKAFAESRKNGPIVTKVVSVYLNPTTYSPVK
tara:strand:- start:484 stop:945 length:462 start_codon:yes stop_codon:yes gene_type:complete